jgi:hypothetical protein
MSVDTLNTCMRRQVSEIDWNSLEEHPFFSKFVLNVAYPFITGLANSEPEATSESACPHLQFLCQIYNYVAGSSLNSKIFYRRLTEGWPGQSRFSLEKILSMSINQMQEVLHKELKPMYEACNIFPSLQITGINDHGIGHVRSVVKQQAAIHDISKRFDEDHSLQNDSDPDQEEKAEILAALLHDIGMIFGRDGHENDSVSLIRHLIPDWDPNHVFCKRVEFLVLHHTTEKFLGLDDGKQKDKGLITLILADELHLDGRKSQMYETADKKTQAELYESDTWIQLATHIRLSEIMEDREKVVWQITLDSDEAIADYRRELDLEASSEEFTTEVARTVFTEEKKELFNLLFSELFPNREVVARIGSKEFKLAQSQ